MDDLGLTHLVRAHIAAGKDSDSAKNAYNDFLASPPPPPVGKEPAEWVYARFDFIEREAPVIMALKRRWQACVTHETMLNRKLLGIVDLWSIEDRKAIGRMIPQRFLIISDGYFRSRALSHSSYVERERGRNAHEEYTRPRVYSPDVLLFPEQYNINLRCWLHPIYMDLRIFTLMIVLRRWIRKCVHRRRRFRASCHRMTGR